MSAAFVPASAAAQSAPTGAPRVAAGTASDEGPQPAGQPDRVTGKRSYDAAWFQPFSPATALQIVQRVPGFALEETDSEVRGFGGAAGNVVINGQRPSAKSDGIATILGRIPASRVMRVEIAPGDFFGAEYSGKAQVLNLVTTATAGLGGTVEGSFRRDFTGRILPEGTASALLRRGASTFDVSLAVDNSTTSEEGSDTILTLPARELVELRRKRNTIRDPSAALSGSWTLDHGTHRTAHLNARIAVERFRLDQASRVTPTGAAPRDDALNERYDLDEWELGGDVTRPFAGGGLKLIGLATRRRRDNLDVQTFDVARPSGFRQTLDDRLSETLARIVWSRGNWNGWTVELGGEGVLNQLRSRVDLFERALGGGERRIDLAVDDATVREVRGEAFANVGRALSPKLRIDGGVTVEASRLTVSGDVDAKRTLAFLKPKLVLDWRPTAKWHAQLSVQRTVNQLQFTDFISVAELSNDRVNGGNAELVPQRSWELRATLERPILGDGLARLELGYNRISLVQDRVPTDDGFDAPGNLGDGDVLIARLRLEAPLKTLGVKGGRLTLYGSLVPTYVGDPYTGRVRPFTGNNLFLGQAQFRQDLGKFAWGFNIEGATASSSYRRNEIDRRSSNVYGQAFAEWRPDPQTTLTFTLENMFDARGFATRTFYLPDRRNPAPTGLDLRERSRRYTPVLTFKRTFG